MIDKRKPSVISIKTNVNVNNNDNIICNKHPQQKNIGSILKNSFNNTKMNNSISFGNNFHLNRGTVLNYKTKNNIQSSDPKIIDTTLNELNNTCINLL